MRALGGKKPDVYSRGLQGQAHEVGGGAGGFASGISARASVAEG